MTPVTIERVSLRQVNLPPKVLRTDAIQSFVTQETILLTLHCSDGISATGYAYTIGTGGSSVIAFVTDPDGYKIELIQKAPKEAGVGLR